MDQDELDIATLRAFNRAYTIRLGLLNARLDKSPFTLSEARVLYELAHRTDPTAAELGRALHLDRAQVSRTLKRFSDRGLLDSRNDPSHGRNQLLSLTAEGREAFDGLDGNTRAAIGSLLDELPPLRRHRLLSAAGAITRIFTDEGAPTVSLRGLRPGDLGLVAARQGILYADEYGWNSDYEALVARILADIHQSFDPAKDAAWIAEMDDRMVGSIFLVHGDAPEVAKLRLLYVEPDARGAGVGKRLVATCIERARTVGYKRLDLWTTNMQAVARSIYKRAGFVLMEERPGRMFGHDLIGQTWSLAL
ncbi:bifunctional helix-turn-helix transcriptional regulator/GNAT family N-acetyltransferase [Sphingomonas sp. PR090111-T3T-6A]|uniref:bifunctional helix-turn-helix transcriptional regulator/GNAT family N-acetyltransferase n=1 Tax=Sphingomonas sp. PR090111-T3T-6A TaxID=685778 RepID=UPI00037B728E|nr:helix-turn-helix domain-containing GNAT family N-acetyltransferase [Sphingomonas sp. PR090111-T3T-6A]